MKTVFTLIIASLFSVSALAHTSWVCTTDKQDRKVLELLKLPGYLSQNGVFVIPQSRCGLPHIMVYQDACNVGLYNLLVGAEQSISYLSTENATRFFKLNCAKASNTEESRPDHRQAPQDTDHPSHGGGN